MKKLKIAVVDPSAFTPPYDHSLAVALAQQGCEVVLVTTQPMSKPWIKGLPYECWDIFYQVTRKVPNKKIRTYLKGLEHPWDSVRLFQRLSAWKPDIIHFQWLPFPAVDGLFLRLFRKIAPLVLTVHDTEPFGGVPSSRLQLVGLSAAFRCFDHYIVHTQYSKEALMRQLALHEYRVTVIPMGAFTYYRELISDMGEAIQAPQLVGKKNVLFLGVLKQYKGVDILLEAFARLPESLKKKAVLQIVGYPRMPVEPLRAIARRLGIDDQVFWDLRFVEEKEVAAYFAQADVVVLPYRRIDQSAVLMVALAFGKPVIASCVGGLAEIIKDGIHGFLVKPGDVESLAQALTCILADDELRMRMASAVQRLANEELSWDTVAKQTIQLYEMILG
jgi:glycosyltransferase involved in cell wall biosynthesis